MGTSCGMLICPLGHRPGFPDRSPEKTESQLLSFFGIVINWENYLLYAQESSWSIALIFAVLSDLTIDRKSAWSAPSTAPFTNSSVSVRPPKGQPTRIGFGSQGGPETANRPPRKSGRKPGRRPTHPRNQQHPRNRPGPRCNLQPNPGPNTRPNTRSSPKRKRGGFRSERQLLR